MATSTPNECGVCHEEYDEESRCPRIFPCFHSICTYCTKQLIKHNSKLCPFCRGKFRANSIDDVKVNHTALELLKYFTLQEPSSKSALPGKGSGTPREKTVDFLKEKNKKLSNEHYVNCLEAEEEIENIIKEVISLQKNIMEENSRLENTVFPGFHDVISRNNRRVENLDKTNKTLHNQLKTIKENNIKLEEVKGNLDSCTAHTFKETAILLDEVEETNSAIGGWIENVKELISEEQKTLQMTKKKLKKTKEQINIVLEVISSQETSDEEEIEPTPITTAQDSEVEEIEPTPGIPTQEDIVPTPSMAAIALQEPAAIAIQEHLLTGSITLQALRGMSHPVKQLVEEGRIFAVKQHQGQRRCARICIVNNKLWLNHLKEEPVPPNAHIFKHDDVMRLVQPSTRLTFLELSVDGLTLGRLYIRINNTKLATHFSLLCTGENGPSYANTKFIKVVSKGDEKCEWVKGGDYERNNGLGGKAVMPDLSEEEWNTGEYSQPWLAGSVEGGGCDDATAAQFIIYTGDFPGARCYPCIGIIEDGLFVLTEAISHYPNIRDVFIKDCGVELLSF